MFLFCLRLMFREAQETLPLLLFFSPMFLVSDLLLIWLQRITHLQF